MKSLDIKPPEHQRRALRIVVGCAVVFVVLVIASIACATYLFTAPFSLYQDEEHGSGEGDVTHNGTQSRRAVRSFFEVADEGEQRVKADIELALGHVTISTAEQGALFQVEGVVIGTQLRPRFDHGRNGDEVEISLSLDGEDVSFRGLRGMRGSNWQLYFSDSIPLDLDLTLGAAEGDLNFTGIPVENLSVECGMASISLRFDEPNPVVLHRLDIEAGLSEFTARGLGNARFESFEFDGGAGEFTLDFSGEAFMPGAEAEINVGLASLTVLLPLGQPVVVEAPVSFMTRVEFPESFKRIGRDSWASPNAAGNPHTFHIEIDAGPGSIEVKLVE